MGEILNLIESVSGGFPSDFYEYVVDLRNRLQETLQLAQEELKKNKSRYKFYADRK